MSAATQSESTYTAASYLRVSTKEQADREGDPEGYSIPAQREANLRKAASLDAAIVAEFVDRGESARSADRPQLQALLRFVRDNKVDFVIVHKVDRLARNRMDDVEINLALKQAGVTLVSATESIDETPSGMLLHGIMSSIAEFYSRNLATEVVKGMNQKAKSGGTPGLAPLGYLNSRATSPEGREIRTITIDPERGPMIRWAFEAYASGAWTIGSLTRELETRGLTTRPTPKRSARTVPENQVHRILRSPYYKGVVVWGGAQHPGRHEPLIDARTWQRVQDVLDTNRLGEKQREHPHYLKTTVRCGGCGSRLIVNHAKNRYGTVYPYFTCLGRHGRRNYCQRKAVLIATVEDRIVEYYQHFKLPATIREEAESVLMIEFRKTRVEVTRERAALELQHGRIKTQQAKLLQAHYAGAVPLDLMKSEQDRLGDLLATVQTRLDALVEDNEQAERNLRSALDLLSDCGRAYAEASDSVRRRLNQALFTAFYVEEDGVRADLAEPFRSLLAPELISASVEDEEEPERAKARLGFTEAIERALSRRRVPTLRIDFFREGLKQINLVPRVGVEPTLNGF